ncbi:hypothetical protein [Streptomyces sp. NPDC053431]|uniref:hypothetical protein n=1 Tax=Streptomyces sp. NPDC053431 TaxID=3365703 RepID=UPI0037D6EEE3
MTTDARDDLTRAERLRRQARGDLRPSSVPLIIFGAVTLLGSPLAFDITGLGKWFWMPAGPVCFVLVAAWYRRQAAQSGVGAGRGSYFWTGLATLLATALLAPVGIWGLTTMAFALVLLAVLQHNAFLVACALAYGVIGTLEQQYVLDQCLNTLALWSGWNQAGAGYFSAAPVLVYGLLGLSSIGAGLLARQREQAGS